MHRSVGVRIATLVLVASLAAPAFAVPPRDDSPIDRVERAISRLIDRISHVFDLTDNITIPK